MQCLSFAQCSSLSLLYTVQCVYNLHSAVLSPIFTQCSVYHLHSAVLSPIVTLCSVYNLHSAVLSPIFTPCNVYCLHSAVLSHIFTQWSVHHLHSAVLSPIFTLCSVYHLVIYTVRFYLPSLQSEDWSCLPLSAWKQANNAPINLSQVVVTNAFKGVVFCDPVFCLSVHLGFVLQAEKTGHVNT